MNEETNVKRVGTTSAKECSSKENLDEVVGMKPKWQHGRAGDMVTGHGGL